MTDILTASNTTTHRMMSAPPDTTTTAATATTTSYEPRRSTRVQGHVTQSDGDVWEEKLVVCEAAHGKMVIRSYFRNARTKQRAWDEPPSGSSRIQHASAAERTEKEEELKNLQVAMMDNNNNNAPQPHDNNKKGSKPSKGGGKGKGFFSAFRKKDGKGLFGIHKKDRKSSAVGGKLTPVEEDMDGDEDMQRAIQASMGVLETTTVAPKKSANNKKTTTKISRDEQEQLDIAKAISLSQFAENGAPVLSTPQQSEDEEEMLQRAIEQSRIETTGAPVPASGVASMPEPTPDFLGLSEDFSEPLTTTVPKAWEGHDSDSSFFNKKMPAQPAPFSSSSTLGPPPPAVSAAAAPYIAAASAKPAPVVASYNQTTAAASLKPPPAAAAAASLKPPPPTAASFDPYAPKPAATATTQYPAFAAQPNAPMDDSSLRKMEGDNDKTASTLVGRRMYNKKSVQVQAGVV